MKRLIAVLLVMGVIMTAFADDVRIGQIELDSSYKEASSTTVSLTLSGNFGRVWFSIGSGNSAISDYALTMQKPNELVESLRGNTGEASSPKVYAKSGTDSEGLYLNWNIVSTVSVDVYLEITAPMVRSMTGEARNDDKIGWIVESGGQTLSVTDSGHVTSGKAVVYTKQAEKYGEASSQIINVETDNVWGKNNGDYTATLKAYIKTTS